MTPRPQNPNSKDEPFQEATAVLPGAPKRGGPQTEAGKRAVSQNATTHGITSPSPVAGGEDATEWERFKRGWHDYFKPVGVPEEEIVDFLAITSWRRRRIIRREVALMDARYEAMEDGAQSNTLSHGWAMGERELDSTGCDVDTGTELLQILDTLDANTKLDPEAAKSAFGLLFFCGPLDFRELPERREESSTATAGSFREWISIQAAAEQMTYLEVVQSALQGGERILDGRARRREAAERCRLARERAALMPSVQEMDSLVRHEAHFDRSFARGLSQLEMLQRLRNGEQLPPPERVEVTVH